MSCIESCPRRIVKLSTPQRRSIRYACAEPHAKADTFARARPWHQQFLNCTQAQSEEVRLAERSKVAQRRSRLLAVWRDKSAVTALEYGLIAALIAIVIITALSSVGKALQNVFNNIAGNL